MNAGRLAIVIVIALVAIVAACQFATQPTSLGSGAVADKKWEYCSYSIDVLHGYQEFADDTQRHVEKTSSSLAEKIGLKLTRDGSIALVNALGNQGWELVNHSVAHNLNGDNISYVFKRAR